MMLPIAMSVVNLLSNGNPEKIKDSKPFRLFALGLLISIAYSANIGGTATLIGTPPNVVLAGYMNQMYNIDLEFGKWILIGLPFAVVLLSITYLMITRVLFANKLGKIEGADELISSQLQGLGPVSKNEKLVGMVFGLTAFCWIFKSQINGVLGAPILSDTITAMAGGTLMFIIPSNFRKAEFLLGWESTKRLPWGILILFGGGMTLAKGMETTGLIQVLGDTIANNNQLSLWMLIGVLTLVMLFMTELMSNVALATIFVPVVMGIADSMGVDPTLLAIPVTLAASCAFMMPISTPPNAIVFASGYIRMKDMIKAGFFLNLISIVIITILSVTLISWVYG